MIGDPSGRTDMRQILTETIQLLIARKKQMERFIDFSDGKALMVKQCRLAARPQLC